MGSSGYTLDAFVADLQIALRQPVSETDRLAAGADALRRLLANPEVLAPYEGALAVGRGPWLLHQDAELGFVVTLLRKTRGGTTPVHHHGEAWTLYGIFDGHEVIHRYDRYDDGATPERADVRLTADHERAAGEVEVEVARAIHNETTGSERDTIAIAVRGRDLATVQQEHFDLATGAVRTGPGTRAQPLPDAPDPGRGVT
jgi:predicted metal-dependent enzyme (double-stranded beta helix superfamily)